MLVTSLLVIQFMVYVTLKGKNSNANPKCRIAFGHFEVTNSPLSPSFIPKPTFFTVRMKIPPTSTDYFDELNSINTKKFPNRIPAMH